MHTVDEQKFTGEPQVAEAHYLAMVDIIEQAQSLGLELEGLPQALQDVSGFIPVATLQEVIKQARRKLYLQMMEFEMLDSDLAELQSKLCNTPKKPAVTLTLV